MSNGVIPTGTSVTPPLPPSGSDVAPLPREERRSAQKMARYFHDEYLSGLSRRRSHALAWIMVQSFMKGIHYFVIDAFGSWRPIPADPKKPRAVTPVMRSRYRHVLGFLNSNDPGVQVTPIVSGSHPIYSADRAYAILRQWMDDIEISVIHDQVHQLLLTEGMCGVLRYGDSFRGNVFLKPLASSALFPIPADANTFAECSGLAYAQIVTKQWLELQDEIFERQNPGVPFTRMADRSGKMDMSFRIDLPVLSRVTSGAMDGALALTVWMKGNEKTPGGEYAFLLGDEMVRYAAGINPQTGKFWTETILPNGEIPVEPLYFDKHPTDFWGTGLCESLIPSQFSSDRQYTLVERSVRDNRPLTFYDVNSLSLNDIGKEHNGMIGFNGQSMDQALNRPVFHVPASPVNRDLFAELQMTTSMADEASGLRSGIMFGQQEGRTEGGPATSLLYQNAVSSLTPVFKRLTHGWDRTYSKSLDLIRYFWPPQKVVRVVGRNNVGREMMIRSEDIPWSSDVLVRSKPVLPGGSQTALSMLFQLRNIPGQDGVVGTELSSTEFRQALHELGFLPPGVQLMDRPEQRIQTRINQLVGDTQRPMIPPADIKNPMDRQVMENHVTAVKMLRDVILDDSFRLYSPAVKQVLYVELQFHQTMLHGSQPQEFDNASDEALSRDAEEFLATAEQDMNTPEGDFTFGA